MKKHHIKLFAILVLTTLALAACGGGSSSGELQISVDDSFEFSPSEIEVTAGQELTITFVNNASVEHSFNILKAGADVGGLVEEDEDHVDDADDHDDAEEQDDDHADDEDQADDHDEAEEQDDDHAEEDLHDQVIFEVHAIASGESATETFTAPTEPGEYTFFCAVPGHAEAGLVGTLVVSP